MKDKDLILDLRELLNYDADVIELGEWLDEYGPWILELLERYIK